MTAITQPAPGRRLWSVVRLQFVNRDTFVTVPALVLAVAAAIAIVIAWIVSASGPAGRNIHIVAALQGPLWYFLVIGVQCLAYTFPFSQALSVTRREFFVGSAIAALIGATILSTVVLIVASIEQATTGYGTQVYFALIPELGDQALIIGVAAYFALTLFVFTLGFWFAILYRRFGTTGVTITIAAIVIAGLLAAVVVTFTSGWQPVLDFVVSQGAWFVVGVVAALTVLLAAVSYGSLRKLPAV